MNIHGSRLRALFKRLPGTNALVPLIASRRATEQFKQEFKTFRRLTNAAPEKRFELRWKDRYPYLNDRKSTTAFDRHYVYHTAWEVWTRVTRVLLILAKGEDRMF
jgi:hypothetical protein